MSSQDDPIITSYDVFLTDSEISRYVFQYLDRPDKHPYTERKNQKPTALRLKPRTGLVEVDVPIITRENYDVGKGVRYGEALKKGRTARDGAYGMAGGFSSGGATGATGGGGGRVKLEEKTLDVEMLDKDRKASVEQTLMRTQALGGRIKTPEEGDPVYMLATFHGSMCMIISFSFFFSLFRFLFFFF